MIESKYIEFDKVGDTGKTEIWNVNSKSSKATLGKVQWYGPWRQYCFFPSPSTVFNPTCMSDINKFIQDLMAARRYSKGGG